MKLLLQTSKEANMMFSSNFPRGYVVTNLETRVHQVDVCEVGDGNI